MTAADVAVVGAGPAGMGAAVAAAEAGARVVVLDADARPGGQYWRQGPDGPGRYHHDADGWMALARPWQEHRAAGRIDHRAGHRVWRLDPLEAGGSGEAGGQLVVHTVATGGDGVERTGELTTPAVVVATGAHDRVLPFPGWDLPGVLTPGAVQTLLKEHGVAAGHQVVVAGTGPFLLPVATALLAAGSDVVALLEAGDGVGWLSGGPAGWRALAGARARLGEGAGYAATLARHRVRPRLRHAVVAAHGGDRVEAVTVARLTRDGQVVAGTRRRVACDAVAVGWGFVARAELALAAGAVAVPGPDGGVAVAADAVGRTAVPGLLVAGELTGIGGAQLAVVSGRLAGAAAAGVTAPDPGLLARRRALQAFAELMHRAHRPPAGWPQWLDDDTVVCRCEEVPLRRITEAVDDLGATDARTVKLLTRCGMGWCQGRICADAVDDLVAARTGRPRAPGPGFGARPVAVPVSLGALAEPTLEENP